jgi:hypothetical protein
VEEGIDRAWGRRWLPVYYELKLIVVVWLSFFRSAVLLPSIYCWTAWAGIARH